MNKTEETTVSVESKKVQRKRYHSPKLSSLGTVAQLTRSTGVGMINDGVMMMSSS